MSLWHLKAAWSLFRLLVCGLGEGGKRTGRIIAEQKAFCLKYWWDLRCFPLSSCYLPPWLSDKLAQQRKSYFCPNCSCCSQGRDAKLHFWTYFPSKQSRLVADGPSGMAGAPPPGGHRWGHRVPKISYNNTEVATVCPSEWGARGCSREDFTEMAFGVWHPGPIHRTMAAGIQPCISAPGSESYFEQTFCLFVSFNNVIYLNNKNLNQFILSWTWNRHKERVKRKQVKVKIFWSADASYLPLRCAHKLKPLWPKWPRCSLIMLMQC